MIWFADEEYDQIPACFRSPKGGIHVLATTMPILHKTKHGRWILDNTEDLFAQDSVLRVDLFDD